MFELFVNSDLIRKRVERQFAAEAQDAAEPRFRRLRAWVASARDVRPSARDRDCWEGAEAPSHR